MKVYCKHFVREYYDLENNYWRPAKLCRSPYKCTEYCPENGDLRYRIEVDPHDLKRDN